MTPIIGPVGLEPTTYGLEKSQSKRDSTMFFQGETRVSTGTSTGLQCTKIIGNYHAFREHSRSFRELSRIKFAACLSSSNRPCFVITGAAGKERIERSVTVPKNLFRYSTELF